MKGILAATCLAGAFAVSLSAQQTSTDQKHGGPDQWGNPITVTGCLQAGLTAGTFDLTNVKGLPADKSNGNAAATGTSGTTSGAATDTSKKDKTTLTLTSEGTVDLAEHVGHEVRVTGRLPKKDNRHITEGAAGDQQSSGGAVGAGAQPSGMSTMTSGHGIGGGDARMLQVSAVQLVSSSCNANGGK